MQSRCKTGTPQGNGNTDIVPTHPKITTPLTLGTSQPVNTACRDSRRFPVPLCCVHDWEAQIAPKPALWNVNIFRFQKPLSLNVAVCLSTLLLMFLQTCYPNYCR